MDLHQVGVGRPVGAPDRAQQGLAGPHPGGCAHQLGQQVELGAGERQLPVVLEGPPTVDVDPQRTVAQRLVVRFREWRGCRAGGGRASRSTEQRIDPRLQLPRTERLRQEVVRSRLQPQESVDLVVPSGDHHDVDIAQLADPTARLDAVDPGETEVQRDQVGVGRADQLDALEAVVDGGHGEALARQRVVDERADVLVVLHDQRSALRGLLGHGRSLPETCGVLEEADGPP